MKINTAGTYTLRYSAEDDCGNVGTHDRTLVVASPRTVLYTDGTFIINEQPQDRATNEALHGVATNEYIPFNPNGSTNIEKYMFGNNSDRPWNAQATTVTKVEIGEPISPTKTTSWFANFSRVLSIDLSNLDTSFVTDMKYMFSSCTLLSSVDVSHFDTRLVTDMSYMFDSCKALQTIDISNFSTPILTNLSAMFRHCDVVTNIYLTNINTHNVSNFNELFEYCYALQSLDVSSLDTSNATSMYSMFFRCESLASIDISNFDTSNVTNMNDMFGRCPALTKIFASNSFVTTNVTSSSDMFANMSANLVGGSGTVWRSTNPKDKTYAHIDGGTSNPGYFTLKPTT